MKAAVVTKYGGPEVIKIIEVEKPTPKPNEVLVRIRAFGVTSGDVRIRSAKFPKGFSVPARLALGISAPRKKILGSEFSGVIEAVGSNVKGFKIGDEVIGIRVFNIYAEYVVVDVDNAILHKPKNLSFEEAAGIPFGASTALYFLNKANISAGQSILVNGASGAVGSNAVQIATAMGANVIGVCSSNNTEFVKRLGATEVIDYKQVSLKDLATKFDVVFDTVGNLKFAEYKHLLNPNGIFLQAVATFGELFAKKDHEDGKKFLTGTAPEKKEDLQVIVDLVEAGKLKPSIDKVFEFKDISQAHEYVETGRKKGSVVVRIA
ncbi:MAG: NAD(P)-dependent alcohol dehydrogenase [Candidatus Doudnabacteria bacterium]|nr:NAD(P)-dependent alcohol dehydrogenase [Candidatus Doudnabacteria bacterium]